MFQAGRYQVAVYEPERKGTSTDIFDMKEFRRRYGDDADMMLDEIDRYGVAIIPYRLRHED